jgi:hypothetical protein
MRVVLVLMLETTVKAIILEVRLELILDLAAVEVLRLRMVEQEDPVL